MDTIGSLLDKLKSFCLIGMSGVGKSYWTEQLKTKGYQVFSCDDYIFQSLEKKILKKNSSTESLSHWLGYPDQLDYQAKAAEYLRHENDSLEVAIDFVNSHQKTVIDSSGSMIFCKKDLINKLREHSPIIYLESDKSFYQKITTNFVNDPKPIIWSNHYKPELNLADNFRNLIDKRAKLYQSFADIILNSNQFKTAKTSKEFLQLLENEQAKRSPRSNS